MFTKDKKDIKKVNLHIELLNWMQKEDASSLKAYDNHY